MLDWSPAEYFVNSENTLVNDPYAVINLEGGLRRGNFEIFAQCTNLFDERYAGTVVVDTAAERFYEPAPLRGVHLGVRWHR